MWSNTWAVQTGCVLGPAAGRRRAEDVRRRPFEAAVVRELCKGEHRPRLLSLHAVPLHTIVMSMCSCEASLFQRALVVAAPPRWPALLL